MSAVAGLLCIAYPLAIAILPLLLVRQMASVPRKLLHNRRISRR
jgi:hypothetical protein